MNHRLIGGLQKLAGELSRSSDNPSLYKKHINNFVVGLLKERFPDEQITLKQILFELMEDNHDEGPSSKNQR